MSEYKPRYTGPGKVGICICGCAWDEHHLNVVMNVEYHMATGEAYAPGECEHYGFNEVGGMKFNKETKTWEDHCQRYIDQGEL